MMPGLFPIFRLRRDFDLVICSSMWTQILLLRPVISRSSNCIYRFRRTKLPKHRATFSGKVSLFCFFFYRRSRDTCICFSCMNLRIGSNLEFLLRRSELISAISCWSLTETSMLWERLTQVRLLFVSNTSSKQIQSWGINPLFLDRSSFSNHRLDLTIFAISLTPFADIFKSTSCSDWRFYALQCKNLHMSSMIIGWLLSETRESSCKLLDGVFKRISFNTSRLY